VLRSDFGVLGLRQVLPGSDGSVRGISRARLEHVLLRQADTGGARRQDNRRLLPLSRPCRRRRDDRRWNKRLRGRTQCDSHYAISFVTFYESESSLSRIFCNHLRMCFMFLLL